MSVVGTSAAEHDSTVMEDLVHGQEQAIYGDKAYASSQHKAEAECRWYHLAGQLAATRALSSVKSDQVSLVSLGGSARRASVGHIQLNFKENWDNLSSPRKRGAHTTTIFKVNWLDKLVSSPRKRGAHLCVCIFI